ncbi:MAG TPA: pyruvate dehydrogenase (acetyl-transferring), homodimeric type, partial [Coxiellaceae bacterium]|nr:pyruvate dehydrogenase (acetyl-transferring), homodimeric type [Coxiellaceae bacterium]
MSNPLSDQLQEWLEALEDVIEFEGVDTANKILNQLNEKAQNLGLIAGHTLNTPYLNTISSDQQAPLPDEGPYLQRRTNYMRWNAIAMVMRAGNIAGELGGHIASFASIATLYEVGQTYFFRAPNAEHRGDLVFFQGHS